MNKLISICILLLSVLAHAQVDVKSGTVKNYQGRPTIHVNDQPVSPIFYAPTHAYGGRWSWEEVPQRNIENFCKIGVKLFQLDLYFEDIWLKNSDTLNITKARKQVQGVLDACPDASIVLRVHVNAPFWWNDNNPNESTGYVDGKIAERPFGPPFNNEDGDPERSKRTSLASMKWKKAAGDKLQEFCKKLASSKEGDAVIGLHISGGVYGEWHYWGYPSASADNGIAMTNYFRSWLKIKYKSNAALQKAWLSTQYTLENASVPDTSERKNSQFGIFRTPEKEMRTIDYFTCQQELVADDIEYFCKIAKDNWPRPLMIGVFYGYFHMTFSRQASGGHLAIERILNSPYIDYLSAPQSYWGGNAEVGGSGHSRGIIESALLHGKLWLDEVDNGGMQETNSPDVVRSLYNTDPKYLPVIRRSAVHPLSRGIGLWYYDFGLKKSLGWWDNPDYSKTIKEDVAFFNGQLHKPYKSDADVLFVWDQESFYYIKDDWTPLSYNFLDQTVVEAYKAGVVMDHIYLFDLPKANLKQYKAIVFMNVYKINASMRSFIDTKVCNDNRTIFWQYLPGVTDGNQMNLPLAQQMVKIGFKPTKYEGKPSVIIKIDNELQFEYDLDAFPNPAIAISDPTAKAIGFLNDSKTVIMAQKQYKTHTIIYSVFPIHTPELYRKLFSNAGCHIYSNANDVIYANSDIFWIHSLAGGNRKILLKKGKTVELMIPKLSTTIYNAETGEKLY